MPAKYFIPELTKEEPYSEQWRSVVGYEGIYLVSDLARLKRIAPMKNGRTWVVNRLLSPANQRADRYLTVTLRTLDGAKHSHDLHVLVAKAFLGPRPDEWETNHKDTNKWNCRLSNLEYLSKADHTIHQWATGQQMGFGEGHGNSMLTASIVTSMRTDYDSGMKAAAICKKYNACSLENVWHIVKRYTWKHLP